jgi:hypothetical protein
VNDLGGSVTGDGSGGDAANDTAQEIKDNGGEAVADTNSVATPEGGRAIIDTALNTWGRVDILVNNAGTVSDAAFEDMTEGRLSPLVDVHLKGRLLRNPAGVEGDAAAEFWPHCQHLLGGGHPWRAADEQLRSCQDRAHRAHPRVGAKPRARHQDQCDAPVAATRMMDYSMGSAAEVDNSVRTRGAKTTEAEELMRPFLDRLDPALVPR